MSRCKTTDQKVSGSNPLGRALFALLAVLIVEALKR
jgi:hypothetical protein